MTTSAPALAGGRYEIGRVLGQGSFGHTFLARDREQNRDVAIKVLDRRARDDWKAYELFKREADVLASLRHHGIPQVFDTLEDAWNGAPAAFLVMEYVEGDSLAKIIADRRPLDPADVVHLLLELLSVLDYLHGRVPPILHRDIKPANIIVRPNGFPALVDFGSVRRVFLGPDESGSTVAGTYGYMPYEQYMGQATPSSDLYSLAGTFLHLITGRAPREFMSDDGQIAVPATLPGEQYLRPVLARMLRPAPVERFATARDVRAALVSGSTAVVPASTRTGGVTHVRRMASVFETLQSLPAAPRKVEGPLADLHRAASPGTVRLMSSSEKATRSPGLLDYVWVGLVSVFTIGILPAAFLSYARARRQRMKLFIERGQPTVGEITRIDAETTAFAEKTARVTYEFEADGQRLRDSDTIMPVIAHRWDVGDQIPVLYIAERDYDSVIVAVE